MVAELYNNYQPKSAELENYGPDHDDLCEEVDEECEVKGVGSTAAVVPKQVDELTDEDKENDWINDFLMETGQYQFYEKIQNKINSLPEGYEFYF